MGNVISWIYDAMGWSSGAKDSRRINESKHVSANRRIDESKHVSMNSAYKTSSSKSSSSSTSSKAGTSGSGSSGSGSGGSGSSAGTGSSGSTTSNAVVEDVTGNAIKSQKLEPIDNKANKYTPKWKDDNDGWKESTSRPKVQIFISRERYQENSDQEKTSEV